MNEKYAHGEVIGGVTGSSRGFDKLLQVVTLVLTSCVVPVAGGGHGGERLEEEA